MRTKLYVLLKTNIIFDPNKIKIFWSPEWLLVMLDSSCFYSRTIEKKKLSLQNIKLKGDKNCKIFLERRKSNFLSCLIDGA